jgi:hypothetical protein
MSIKVKRGLGLLVVAVLAFIVTAYTQAISDSGNDVGNVVVLFVSLFAIVLGGLSLLGGLALVAWGLLRD